MDINGSRVLVLGGSGVLGGAIAAELVRRGASVSLAGRDADRLTRTASELGGSTPSILFDLAVPGHAEHVVDTAIDQLGGLDGIVNAAGVVAFGPLEELSDDALDQLAATDLVGPLKVMRVAIDRLESGFLVNLTGVVAEAPVAGMSAYSAMKSGLSAAARALGRELRRRGFHVLDARPPHTETGLADRPIAGTAPAMPEGLAPQTVARVVVDAIESERRELAATDFTNG